MAGETGEVTAHVTPLQTPYVHPMKRCSFNCPRPRPRPSTYNSPFSPSGLSKKIGLLSAAAVTKFIREGSEK